jgi:hypothetical protein
VEKFPVLPGYYEFPLDALYSRLVFFHLPSAWIQQRQCTPLVATMLSAFGRTIDDSMLLEY